MTQALDNKRTGWRRRKEVDAKVGVKITIKILRKSKLHGKTRMSKERRPYEQCGTTCQFTCHYFVDPHFSTLLKCGNLGANTPSLMFWAQKDHNGKYSTLEMEIRTYAWCNQQQLLDHSKRGATAILVQTIYFNALILCLKPMW